MPRNIDQHGFRKSAADEWRRSFDAYAHALTVISEPHRMIHDGRFFNASGIVTGIGAGADFNLLLQFPAGEIGHLTLIEYTIEDAPVTIEFYENTTISAAGVTVNVQNHNRVGTPTASDVTVTHTPTITADGDLLHERWIPSTGAGQSSGALVAGGDQEWVLGHPTLAKNYMWRLTNNTVGSIKCGFHFNGYQIEYES